MPEVPDYLVKIRAYRTAELAVMDAIEEAFPRGSRWLCEGAVVTVTGADGGNMGNVWVNLDTPPFWQKSVYCCSLKPLPTGEPECTPTTSTAPAPPAATSTGVTSPGK